MTEPPGEHQKPALSRELQAALMTWKLRRYGTADPELPSVRDAEDWFFTLWSLQHETPT